MKNKITFERFLEIEKDLEIKVGIITEVIEIPKSKKLIQLTVSFNDITDDVRTVVTNIKEDLLIATDNNLNKLIACRFNFITNLEPVKIMGIESTAMICPIYYYDRDAEKAIIFLNTNNPIGSKIF